MKKALQAKKASNVLVTKTRAVKETATVTNKKARAHRLPVRSEPSMISILPRYRA